MGKDGPAAGGQFRFFLVQGAFGYIFRQSGHQGMGAMDICNARWSRMGKGDARAAQQIDGGQSLPQLGCKMLKRKAKMVADHLQRGTQTFRRPLNKAGHIGFTPQHLDGFLPFGQHLIGFQTTLGKDGLALFGLFLGTLPGHFHFLIQVIEREQELLSPTN